MAEHPLVKLLRGWLFVAVGAVLLGTCSVTALGTNRFLREAEVAEGRVVRLNAGPSHPEVAFTTRAGDDVSFPQGGWISGFGPGQRVRVLYLPEDPRRTACIDQLGALWAVPVFTGPMGLAFLSIGTALIVFGRGAALRSPSR